MSLRAKRSNLAVDEIATAFGLAMTWENIVIAR